MRTQHRRKSSGTQAGSDVGLPKTSRSQSHPRVTVRSYANKHLHVADIGLMNTIYANIGYANIGYANIVST
jgi:hypothetical protein